MNIDQQYKKLGDLKSRIAELPYEHRAVWCNGKALRVFLAEKRQSMLAELTQHPGASVLDPNAMANGARIVIGNAGAVIYANVKAAVDLIESLPEFIAAGKIIDPLVDEVRKIESQIKAEEEATATIEDQRRAALAQAKAAALAKVEAEFATA